VKEILSAHASLRSTVVDAPDDACGPACDEYLESR
jgi:hypothetical protein